MGISIVFFLSLLTIFLQFHKNISRIENNDKPPFVFSLAYRDEEMF
jgi:hypothetical protein